VTRFGPGQPEGWREPELIDQMIRTLRHAANIRGLTKDDLVTICVSGMTNPINLGVPPEGLGAWPMLTAPTGPTFTVQASRSDIELFASGQMTLEQFKAKVKQLRY
jgi:hypothetical protein